MNEQEMRQAIIAALDEFMYRLETRFVTRDEYKEHIQEAKAMEVNTLVLSTKFDSLFEEFQRLRRSADRAVWALFLGVAGWIGTMILNVLTSVL